MCVGVTGGPELSTSLEAVAEYRVFWNNNPLISGLEILTGHKPRRVVTINLYIPDNQRCYSCLVVIF